MVAGSGCPGCRWAGRAAEERCSADLVPLGAFALLATDGIPTRHVRRALVAFADVTGADSLQERNDAPERSREEVLSALQEAIEQVELAQ